MPSATILAPSHRPNAVQAYRDQFVALIGLADFVLI